MPTQVDLCGRTLDGRYRIDRLVADGGMATVYEALDLRLDRIVAVKVMHQSLVDQPGFVDRFLQEARAAARLSDPHVVTVYDRGSAPEAVYLVLELIQGRTLRQEIVWGGRLSTSRALDILSAILQGLEAAHGAGFVHGDIKPENVLLGDLGGVKVTDFGLARAIEATQEHNSLLLGTAAYLAPEQATQRTPDPRSDLYSAGLVFFEMLTGHVPFRADTANEVLSLHQTQDVPTPSMFVDVPASVDALTAKATNRHPGHRFQTAGEMLVEVDRLRADIPRDDSPPRMIREPAPMEAPTQVVDPVHATFVQPTTGDGLDPMPLPPVEDLAQPEEPIVVVETEAVAPVPPPREPDPPAKAPAPKHRSRKPWALLLILALVAAVGFGAWRLGSLNKVDTPDLAGMTRGEALRTLERSGLAMTVTSEEYSEKRKAGRIISSNPAAGQPITKGGTVSVIMSKGPERYDVPDLTGFSVEEATKTLETNNLTVGQVTQDWSRTIERGLVKGSTPKPGTPLKRDTAVTLIVSMGPEPVTVPDVVGISVEEARTNLQSAGLDPRVKMRFDDAVPMGTVISTDPVSGTSAYRGDRVKVFVSKGADLLPVPGVVGMSTDDARTVLESAGFTVLVEEQFGVTVADRVLSQDPAGDTQAPRGSTITLTVT